MAHEYSVNMSATLATAAAITVVFVNPIAAPNVNLEFLRLQAGQSANATSAMQQIQVMTQATAFPTLTSQAPVNLKRAEAASIITGNTTGAAGTSGVNASVQGAGAKSVIFTDQFNTLNGYLWVPTPRETIILPAGYAQGLGLWFPVAPAQTASWTAGVNFGEV